jgi:glycosyltransferase involved in cell wall biosynthesis
MAVYAGEQPEYFRESVESMLVQDLPPAEFVLICDGPLTPALDALTVSFAAARPGLFRIVRLPEPSGLGIALGEGLLHCTTEYIARMDSDDIALPGRCGKQLSFMREQGLDLCGSAVEEFIGSVGLPSGKPVEFRGKRRRRRLPLSHEELVRFSRWRNPMNHPAVMFRRSAAFAAGNYRDMPGFEDYDLWLRMIHSGAKLGNLEEALVYMRIGAGLYRRRGGFEYIRLNFQFWKRAYLEGFVNMPGFLAMVICRTAVSLLPDFFRAGLYRVWLREA